VPDDRHADPVFLAAVGEIEAGIGEQRDARAEISFESEPPPRRLAPDAAAVAAIIEVAGQEIGWGRFVLLYDPAGQDGWAGPFRVIAYVRAELEPEIAADPLIGGVGWSWLTEALEARDAGYAAPSGTVTRVVTEGFGTKQDEPVATEFEMRASWSPASADGEHFELDRHVAAWAETLCQAAGLPPVPPGVAQLRPPQPRRPRPGRRP
jgi:Protein of unknown function (DUF3000)